MSDVIDSFLDEVRRAGRKRGLLTEDHVEIIRSGLVNSRNAAGDDTALLELWDAARGVIVQRDKSVKWRLEQMGVIADRWNEKRRGRTH